MAALVTGGGALCRPGHPRLEEPEGLNSIVAEFRRRARRPGGADEVAEAMLAQLPDLAARLASVGMAPKDMLDEVEPESTWLRNKAFRRVWHSTSLRRTPAMTRTPRNVLEVHAREGNWWSFPLSPRPYHARLNAIYRDGYADYSEQSYLTLVRYYLERPGIRSTLLAADREDTTDGG